MKVKLVGTALIVASALTAEQLENAKHFCPDALAVHDEDGNSTFRVDKADTAAIGKYGTIFNGADAEGKLTATVVIPDVEDKKDYVAKEYGVAIAELAKAETVIAAAINETMATVNGALSEMEVE